MIMVLHNLQIKKIHHFNFFFKTVVFCQFMEYNDRYDATYIVHECRVANY